MTDIATNLLGKRVTVRKYIQGNAVLDGSWENYSGIVRAVSTAKYDEHGVSFHLLIETVSSDRKGNRSGPSRLFVADVSSDEVHVVPEALPEVSEETETSVRIGNSIWLCPAASRECLIRQQCTNKCGKNDPKP